MRAGCPSKVSVSDAASMMTLEAHAKRKLNSKHPPVNSSTRLVYGLGSNFPCCAVVVVVLLVVLVVAVVVVVVAVAASSSSRSRL